MASVEIPFLVVVVVVGHRGALDVCELHSLGVGVLERERAPVPVAGQHLEGVGVAQGEVVGVDQGEEQDVDHWNKECSIEKS